jgi:hypothetical protein
MTAINGQDQDEPWNLGQFNDAGNGTFTATDDDIASGIYLGT